MMCAMPSPWSSMPAPARTRAGMGDLPNWVWPTVNTIVSGGMNFISPYVERQTGWDLNPNYSPTFRSAIPLLNMVGDAFFIGPAGEYLSASGNAIEGGAPIPGVGLRDPMNPTEPLGGRPAAPTYDSFGNLILPAGGNGPSSMASMLPWLIVGGVGYALLKDRL